MYHDDKQIVARLAKEIPDSYHEGDILTLENLTDLDRMVENGRCGPKSRALNGEKETTFHDQKLVARLNENIPNEDHIGNILKKEVKI